MIEAVGAWLKANGLFFVEVVLKASVLGLAVQGLVAYIVLAERRTASWIQDQIGPNRCGPWGLLQPLADGVKLMFKEDILPDHVDKVFFTLAPALSLLPALATLAVVPFGGDMVFEGGRVVSMQVADLDIGVLYVISLSSLGVYGLALGGWASGSKYSLLGAIRSSAQMISYELPLALSMLTVIVATGSLRLNQIVLVQGWEPWKWHVFGFGGGTGILRVLSAIPLFVAATIFVVASFAETNRMPFDMPEAESELVSGYHTEFSSMKFGLFFLAEYANMLTGCALTTSLFLGGWLFPGWSSEALRHRPLLFGACALAMFTAKTMCCMFVMMWVRWTLPRFRFDQLMAIGWKRLLPASLACLVATASIRVLMP